MTEPLAIDLALQADLLINNLGHHMTVNFLQRGKPVLGLPLTAEQTLLGEFVAKTGCGLSLTGYAVLDIEPALQQIFSEPAFGQQADAFARRNAGHFGEAALQAGLLRLQPHL